MANVYSKDGAGDHILWTVWLSISMAIKADRLRRVIAC
jgi:hypothetical protein